MGNSSLAMAHTALSTAAAPDMSVFMVSMPAGGFSERPTAVEHDALADENAMLLVAPSGW